MKKILIFLIIFVLNSCAYIVNGDTQTIDLKTSDNKKVKAKIEINNEETIYTLPSTISVKKSPGNITVTTIGTECIIPTMTTISPYMDNMTWGNIATLGIGFIQDSKGAMWHYDDAYTIDVNRDEVCIKKAKELNNEIMNLHI